MSFINEFSCLNFYMTDLYTEASPKMANFTMTLKPDRSLEGSVQFFKTFNSVQVSFYIDGSLSVTPIWLFFFSF